MPMKALFQKLLKVEGNIDKLGVMDTPGIVKEVIQDVVEAITGNPSSGMGDEQKKMEAMREAQRVRAWQQSVADQQSQVRAQMQREAVAAQQTKAQEQQAQGVQEQHKTAESQAVANAQRSTETKAGKGVSG